MPPNPHSELDSDATKMSEVKEQDLQILRNWMSKQHHLPKVPDNQLVQFLHSCYYSIERAKDAIDVCYTVKTHTPEIFSDRDPRARKIQEAMDLIELAELPVRDSKGQKLLLARLKDFDTSRFIFEDVAKGALLGLEIILKEDPTVPGYVIVFDMTGFSLMHVAKLNISTVRKLLIYVQEGFPLRMKAVHVLNTTPVIDKVLTLIKPFLHKELASILNFHKGENLDFYKEFGRDLMPADYGGKQKSVAILNSEIRKKIAESKKYVEEEAKWRVDEMKRSTKFNSRGDLFGMEGSFKKLSID